MNERYKLKIMIPCRDRLLTTLKTIESIRTNSTIFDKIDIYLFDNLSLFSKERFLKINELLENNIIQYYSYDTEESLTKCFGKAVVFQRWLKMMQTQEAIEKHNNLKENISNFYVLLDNDMILCKKWDEYFISVSKQANIQPSIHFIVQYPGGTPRPVHNIKSLNLSTIKNMFNQNHESISYTFDCGGGSSGFWFMTSHMLTKMEWSLEDISTMYEKTCYDDVKAWSVIKKKYPNKKQDYLIRILPPENEALCIHLGGVIGSIINNMKHSNYNKDKIEEFQKDEEEKIYNFSLEEIYELYKSTGCKW